MDDQKTQHELDALADLFLTGTRSSRLPTATTGAEVSAAPAPSPSSRSHPLNAPPPLRLPPKTRPVRTGFSAANCPAPASIPSPDEPASDIVASILPERGFSQHLREALHRQNPAPIPDSPPDSPPDFPPNLPPDSPHEPAAQPTVHIEAVFLGSLPGFGGPWLTQYAHHLAQRYGPIIVVHADEAQIEMELVRKQSVLAEPAAGPAAPTLRLADDSSSNPTDSPVAMIERLIQRQEGGIGGVLVHIHESAATVSTRQALRIKNWTLLCGAYDAAVVGGYRLLKEMFEAFAGSSTPAFNRKPTISLMVLGSDEDRSRAAARKLNAATGGFLQAPVELVGWQKQMVPVQLDVIGSFAANEENWADLLAYLEELAQQTPAIRTPETPTRLPPPAPVPAALAPRDWLAADLAEEPQEAPEPGPRNTATPPAAATAAIPTPAPEPDPPAGAQNTQVDSDTAVPSSIPGDIPESIPGGIALAARCPKHPHTQLVLDQDGRMHLLERPTTAGELRTALVDLLETSAWVRQHLALLALTQRQCRFDPAAAPVLHLFTNQAKAAVQLAGNLGPTLKLHLLQEVRVGSQVAQVCTELN